jgi:septal ring factor EnvC (AmiA/AmiB activator)
VIVRIVVAAVVLAAGGIVAGHIALAQPALDQKTQVSRARAEASAAASRAAALDRLAAGEQDQVRQARAREAAVAARIEQAEADIAAGRAQAALVDQLLEAQHRRLARQQQPVARLLAALQSLARRPALLSIVQPGSIDDIVHVRAVLAGALPVLRARSGRVRADLARSRLLQSQAELAGQALAESRSRLEAQRLSLGRLEQAHRSRALALGHNALFESDRAIALGETAREMVDMMDQADTAASRLKALATLPAPDPRPGTTGAGSLFRWWRGAPYRLPVTGRLVAGFGEVSDAGVRSRGLTLVTAAGAAAVAPAAGRVAFAGAFRGYGTIVILDHGGGWTSLISGLGTTPLAVGEQVAQGARIGTAATTDAPRVTIELRRRDRPIDMTALLGG